MASYAPAQSYGPYDAYEVRSALRKEIKLANLDAAIYWANVMVVEGGKAGRENLARQLWIMSTEDLYSTEVVVRAFCCFQMLAKVPETDQLFYLVALMCRAPKWWESAEGRAVDVAWAKATGDLKDPLRRRQIPPYALDRHTRRGWAIKRAKGWWDDRYSGTDLGRQKTVWLFLRDGKLDPEAPFDAPHDAGFLAHWRWFKQLYGGPSREEEPNDPDPAPAGEPDPPVDPCLFDAAEVGGDVPDSHGPGR